MKHLTTLLTMAITTSCFGQVPDYVPTDGLVAWFDFGNGLEDQTGNLELTLHGGAQLANGALDVSEYGAWAESSELPSSFEGNPEFSVVALLQCQMEHVSAASWGIGGGSDAGDMAQNINSWNHNSTNQVVLDLWGTTTLGSGLEYNQESFDVAFWSKANSNFSSDNILLGLNGDVVGGAGLTYLRGQSNQPNLPSGGKLFLGKAGLEDAYYGPFKIKSFGLFDRALDVEEYILIRSNLVAESLGCTSANACNYDASAMFDDGSCLYLPETSLIDNIEVTSDGILIVNVPSGLNEWMWDDGSIAPTLAIAPFQEHSLTGMIGEAPEVGQLLGEGVVFHVDTESQTALIASPTSIGEGVEWGCKFVTTGAAGWAIGDGAQNTALILEACGDEEAAARVASNYGEGWFLPSMAELAAIYENVHITGQGDYFVDNTHNWFWSSTECATNGTAAGDIWFQNGDAFECNNKDSNPGGVIAAKLLHYAQCTYTDSLYIELGTPPPFCGEGTYWDTESQNCVIANPSDTNFDGCVSMTDLLDLLSVFGTCNEVPWSCGDPIEYQGYDYETVQIEEQCWFAENLRVTSYRNGEGVDSYQDPANWASASNGGMCTYGNSSSNDGVFGLLYNWYAVDDARGLCPSGWSVPTDGEWMTMEMSLGMSEAEANGTWWRGTNQGSQMKLDYGWSIGGNGTNSSGFSGLPGGYRESNGNFSGAGYDGNWWSSSSDGANAWHRFLFWDAEAVNRGVHNHRRGVSVRCIKDSE